MNSKLYNSKEKGEEIRPNNLSTLITIRENKIGRLEKEIAHEWQSIKSKRKAIKDLREQWRSLRRELNRELRQY